MPSTPTVRNRLEKQVTGENVNTWGDKLNQTGLTLIDEALDGVEAISITSAAVTLTSSNYVSDQARNRALVLTGALTGNTTITVPSVEKVYLVDDQTTRGGFALTMKTSGGTGYALRPGPQWVYCDATDVRRGQPRMDQLPAPAGAVDMNGQRLTSLGAPTSPTDAASKQYVDATAFALNAGQLPGQAGSAGYFLSTNGSVAAWAPAPVLSFNGRGGAITPQAGDYTPALVGAYPAAGGPLSGPAQARQATVPYGASLTLDLAAYQDFVISDLTGPLTLGNPAAYPVGQRGEILIRQDGAGGRAVSFGANWVKMGTGIVNPAAGKYSIVVYWVAIAGAVHYSIVGGA